MEPVGGDDCQNRTARRYEKCSYLWHYFRRFEPFRPSPPRASRETLSRAPFPFASSPPRLDLLYESPYPPSFREARVVLTSSPRSSLRASVSSSLPLLPFPPLTSSFIIPTDIPRRSGRGPHHHHHRRARTTGRDRPHCRGHHFNVTLIKSNNQYLLRKKF